MNALINSKVLTMSSFDLWKKVNELRGSNIRHDDFIKRVEDECDDLGVCDYFAHPQNSAKLKLYQLNKDQMLLVGMRESKVVRKKVLNWIKTLTETAEQPAWISQLSPQASVALEDLSNQLALAAPKVAFVNRFIESTGNKSFREVAKMLKANEREFRNFLCDSKVMYQLGGGWTAHANHIDAGRFYVTGGEANGHAYTTCKFTPKGIEYIAGKWIAHLNN
tara:strand:- start:7 stop:669 length:663 start_codon:yes stop_codon:yes gene_type:complete